MKSYLISAASEHEMKLVQMGAKVEIVNSKMCYIRFNLEGIEIEYVYNINHQNKFFIERVKPYPLALTVTSTEQELISIIEVDLAQFKNAVKSHNINYFLNIGSELTKTIKKFEDLFLYYNIPRDECEVFQNQIDDLLNHIYKTREQAERVYFEKEPDNL
jgi:hypothetical protein